MSVKGEIGTRVASASARLASSARSAANAAETASARLAACGCPFLPVWRRIASASSGSVAFGSPRIATSAG